MKTEEREDSRGVRFPRHMGELGALPRAPPNEAWQPVASVGAASLPPWHLPASRERKREGENNYERDKREEREGGRRESIVVCYFSHIPLSQVVPVIGESFGHNRERSILVFASPTSDMLTSSSFPLLNVGIFHRFLWMIG